jgi:phage shock protein PspC (stress-responsive transcriptional regulator)
MAKLERARADRILFGVCGGLARHLGLDPDLVRVVFLLACAADGMGWVVYLAAYLLVPEESGAAAAPPPARERGNRTAGFGLVGLAVLAYVAGHGVDRLLPWGWSRTWALLIPLLLLACGALLLWPGLRVAAGLAPGARPRRSVSDRVIGGVAGGIAREAGADPALLRLGIVAATVVTWITLPLYVLLVLVLPEEETASASPAIPPAPPTAPEGAGPGAPAGPEPAAPQGQGPTEPGR